MKRVLQTHPWEPQRLLIAPADIPRIAAATAVLHVEDLERSKDFYESLGFRVVERTQYYLLLDHSGARLQLRHNALNPYEPTGEVLFWVEDLQAVSQALGEPVETRSSGWEECSVFDPDGSWIRFAQVKSDPSGQRS